MHLCRNLAVSPVETWPSGRRRSPAKGVCGLNRIEGSNPFVSARTQPNQRFSENIPTYNCPDGARKNHQTKRNPTRTRTNCCTKSVRFDPLVFTPLAKTAGIYKYLSKVCRHFIASCRTSLGTSPRSAPGKPNQIAHCKVSSEIWNHPSH